MLYSKTRYTPAGEGSSGRLDRPASQVPKGSREKGWETIEVAQARVRDLTKEVAYRMRVVEGHFDITEAHMTHVKLETTRGAIERVRRLIGGSFANQVQFAQELARLGKLEKNLP
ncbi:MAG: hypothetical protein HHAS10_05360 [Candidatus Altimarinota bacterium]